MKAKDSARSFLSEDQVWAAVEEVRGAGPLLTVALIVLVALRMDAPKAFANLRAASTSEIVDKIRHSQDPEFVDVFPDLHSHPADMAHLPALVHGIAGWSLPDPGDRAGRGRLALRVIDHAAAAHGRAGDHYTPACLVDLMVMLTAPRTGERIHDAFSRAGELLVGAVAELPARSRTWFSADTVSVDAQRLTRASSLLAGADIAVRMRPVLSTDERSYCDVVLLNPPFGMVLPEVDQHDARWRYGKPPRHSANFAWLQHALSLLSERGRAAVLMANNAGTSDNPTERAIREAMLRAGVIDAVIALPDRLFPSTPIPPSLWMLRPPQREAAVSEVLLVDATSMGVVERGRRVLRDTEIAAIRDAYRHHAGERSHPIAGFTALVPATELASSSTGLSPRAFVGSVSARVGATADATQMQHAIDERTELLKQLRASQESTERQLSALTGGLAPAGPTLRTTIGAVCELKSGPGKFSDEPGAPSIPVVVPRGIRYNRIADAGVTAGPGSVPAKNYKLAEGDVVCVRVGQLGRQGVVGTDQAGWLLGPGCLRIRPGAEVDPRYLTYFLGTSDALDWLDRHATGSAIRGISARVLGELPLVLPTLAEQQRIGAFLRTLDDEAEALDRAAAAVAALGTTAAMQLVTRLPV